MMFRIIFLVLVFVSITVIKGQACRDTNRRCSSWRAYCRYYWGNNFYRTMQQQCRKTCGFCRVAVRTKAPARIASSSSCKDTNRNCAYWARIGQCRSNPNYMKTNCMKSCRACKSRKPTKTRAQASGASKASTCRDYDYRCRAWAITGECNRNRAYMHLYCKKSCRICGSKTVKASPSCIDRNAYCGYWANIGECRRNPAYMNTNCRKSCKFCSTKTTQRGPAASRKCTDLNSWCTSWASRGECHRNPYYMNTNCRKSCKICKIQPRKVTGCKDYKRACSYWNSLNYCRTGRFVKFMRTNCRKTCRICGISTRPTKRPSKTTPTRQSSISTRPTKRPSKTTPTRQSNLYRACGISKKKKRRGSIKGRMMAHAYTWPWQIVLYHGDDICGGTLISPQFVVTAAHCVDGAKREVMSVTVGEYNRDKNEGTEQEKMVWSFKIHKLYDPEGRDHDIALIKLDSPVQLNKHVRTACLPKQNERFDVNSECYVSGWSEPRTRGRSQILQEAEMPAMSNTQCGKRNKGKDGQSLISNNMVCCGERNKSSFSSTCGGDSGGPYVCKSKKTNRWVLQGAISWGPQSCDNRRMYTVSVRVSKYVNWIKQNMKRMM